MLANSIFGAYLTRYYADVLRWTKFGAGAFAALLPIVSVVFVVLGNLMVGKWIDNTRTTAGKARPFRRDFPVRLNADRRAPRAAGTKNRGEIIRRDLLTKELNQACQLDGALNLAAAQAAGANVHTLGGTVHDNTNVLSVGSPGTTGLAVGVADVVAVRHSLVTYLTKLAHGKYTSL
jgi:hypothetical protein